MKKHRILHRSVKEGHRLLFGTLNTFLALILLLQAVVLIFSTLRMELPVPQSLYPRINQELKKSGIQGSWESLSFDLLFGLRINKLKVNLGNNSPLLSADQVFIKVNQAALLCGNFQLDRARISNLTVYNSPIFSADGTASPLLQHVNADIYAHDDTLYINHAIGYLKEISINLTGNIHLKTLPTQDAPIEIQSEHIRLCKYIENALKKLPRIDEPTVELSFDISGSGINTLSGKIETKTIFIPKGTLENASIKFDQFRPDLRKFEGAFRISAEQVKWDTFKAKKLHLYAQNLSLDSDGLPVWTFAAAAANRISYNNIHIDSPVFRTPGNEDHKRIDGTLAASFQKDFFSIHGLMPDGLQGSSTFQVSTELHLANLWEDPFLKSLNLDQILQSETLQKIKTTVNFDPGFSFRDAKFYALIRDLTAHDAHFRYAEIRGSADISGLLVDDIFARNPACEALGSYQQNWKSTDYRMLIEGHIFPQDLNPLFEGWWDGIWERIQPTTTPYVGDVEVFGNWKQKTGGTFLSGYAQNVHSEQGSFIKDVSVKLWYRDEVLHGYDIQLTPEKGYITGTLGVLMHMDSFPVRHNIILDIQGTSTLDFLNTELHLNLDKVFSHIQATDMIESKILTNVILSEDESQEISAAFTAKANKPVIINNVAFKTIRLGGLYSDGKTRLYNIEGRIDNGAVYGNYYLDSTNPDDPFIQLKGEVHNTSVSNLYNILELKESENKSIKGALNGHIFLQGIPGEIKTYTGKGHASLSEAELGKIRTFGIFSRIFEIVKLPIGIFDLNEATSDFKITHGIVETPNLSITGPNATLEANGIYNIENQEIQYNLKCFLLKPPKDSIVSLFGMIFTPLGHLMEMNVTGTINDPKIKLNPLQIF